MRSFGDGTGDREPAAVRVRGEVTDEEQHIVGRGVELLDVELVELEMNVADDPDAHVRART